MLEAAIGTVSPWWERWSDWWSDQQRYFRDPKLRGQFIEHSNYHIMDWRGTFEAASQRRDILIRWGPGTPYFPPRIYPLGCCSMEHQLNDGSMCLRAPVVLEHGWHGVVDILYWLNQAEQWFERFSAENWAIDPNLAPLSFLLRPEPEYRCSQNPGMLIAVPPEWEHGPPAAYGRFTALLPASRKGLGAVFSWEGARGKRVRWVRAKTLVHSGEEIGGTWDFPQVRLDEVPAESLALEHIKSEGFRSSQQKMLKRSAMGKSSLLALCIPHLVFPEQNIWIFRLLPGVRHPNFWEALLNPLCDPVASTGPWPGVSLTPGALNARRIVGRSLSMNQRIDSVSIVIVGLGAIGSEVAHLLAQEGVTRFLLVDGDTLLPGNVARHRVDLSHVGKLKVEAVRESILRVNPSAKVEILPGWLDQMIPRVGYEPEGPNRTILVGLTGHEASEHLLGELADRWKTACLHAWLERNGSLLRVIRVIPDRDPSLRQLAQRPKGLPCPPPAPQEGMAQQCAEMIVPGSASNVHAAGNFVARAILDLIAGHDEDANHFLFAPSGMSDAADEIPLALKRRFGSESYTLKA